MDHASSTEGAANHAGRSRTGSTSGSSLAFGTRARGSRLRFSRGSQPPAWDVSTCSLLGNVGVGRGRKRNRYGALSRAGHRGRIYETDYKRPAAVPLQARTRGVFIRQILGVMTHSHSWRLSFVAVPTRLAHRSRVSGDCGTQ